MTDFYDEAVRYRKTAQKLHRLISNNAPCTCVMSDEYILWAHELEKLKQPLERVRYLMENEHPDTDETCLEVCWRCHSIGVYEDGMGREAIEYERVERIAELQKKGILPIIPQYVLKVFEETFSEYDNERILKNLVGMEEDPIIQLAIKEAMKKVQQIQKKDDTE